MIACSEKINFVIDIFAGSDGLIFVKSMPNERQQHNVSVDSSLFDVKSDVSTETLPKCVKRAVAQLTENTDKGHDGEEEHEEEEEEGEEEEEEEKEESESGILDLGAWGQEDKTPNLLIY